MSRGAVAVAAAFNVAFALQCPLQPVPGRGVMVDCNGLQRVIHGVNAVFKGPPWLPQTMGFDPHLSLSDVDAQLLQSWGLNGVRLGVMWPGAAPAQGQIDQSYLGRARSIVDTLAARDVFTLLDCHQDLLSGKFCGEGAPDWAIDTIATGPDAFPAPLGPAFVLNASGYPSDADCNKYDWSSYQVTVAGSRGYQQLYNTSSAAQSGFVQFWRAVAATFVNASHVIGAELLNEPFAGAVFDNPLLFIPGVADSLNLQPLYDRLAAAIAQVDPTLPIFYESVTVR